MKNKKSFSGIMFFVFILTFASDAFSQEGPEALKFGEKEWMIKNLDVATFRNGDPIPEAKTKEEWDKFNDKNEAAWCYYNFDPKNGDKYGKLYNWFAVNDDRGLAPTGWHVPSEEEWSKLRESIGENSGIKMKSKTGWNKDEYDDENDDGNGTNESGFNGLSSGVMHWSGEFMDIGSNAYWWTTTMGEKIREEDMYAYYYELGCTDDYLRRDIVDKSMGFSVRCVKD